MEMASSIPHLQILSYNIHKGFSLDQKFVLQNIKQAIQLTGADFVCLQEVIGEHHKHRSRLKEWPIEPQLEYLADTVWKHFAYGKNAVYEDGHHGNAIMSRFPIRLHENIDISTNRFERRGLLHAALTLKEGTPDLHLISLHLNLFEKSRLWQIEKLCERIDQAVPHDAPLLIAGDFNDWRESASQILEDVLDVQEAFQLTHGRHAKTFPSWLPMLPLDRIYFRGLELQGATILQGEPWNRLSDHAALTAKFSFTGSI
jgi:endonuclease/exonuclease/phosphatase family metal-dependent hydrolase